MTPRARTGEFLRRLGFHHAGRHRSKAVDLYRQGRINLVLNSEQDSAASEHFQLPRPVGLRHGAARGRCCARAGPRARSADARLAASGSAKASGSIPAVRGAGRHADLSGAAASAAGRSFWDDDFHLLPDAGQAPACWPSTTWRWRLPAGRMDTYILFWRALFGLVPQPLWDTA